MRRLSILLGLGFWPVARQGAGAARAFPSKVFRSHRRRPPRLLTAEIDVVLSGQPGRYGRPCFTARNMG